MGIVSGQDGDVDAAIVAGDSITRYSDWMPDTNASETSVAAPWRSNSRYGVERLMMTCTEGNGRIFSNLRSGVVSSIHSLETMPSSPGGAGRSSYITPSR